MVKPLIQTQFVKSISNHANIPCFLASIWVFSISNQPYWIFITIFFFLLPKTSLLIFSFRICISSLLIIITIKFYILDTHRVISTSMSPTLDPGDRVFTSRIAIGFSIPWLKNPFFFPLTLKHEDMIVFKHPFNNQQYMIKRVKAMPGDSISVLNGKIYINREKIKSLKNNLPYNANFNKKYDQPSWSKVFPNYLSPGTENHHKIIVPKNMIFVLGDAGNTALDSRHFGLVPAHAISGKVIFND